MALNHLDFLKVLNNKVSMKNRIAPTIIRNANIPTIITKITEKALPANS